MTEFLWVLAGAIIMFELVYRSLKRKAQKEADVQKLIQKEDPVADPVKLISVVARSVNDIVATYQDLKICRYVKTEDDRIFVFESIAVERFPGVYAGDDLTATYIVVDKHLLYREVTDELDK